MELRTIQVRLNGEPREWSVYPNELLLNVLREHEFLTGTKYGCGIGECGACTVHINGAPILSCLTLAVACEGKDILTIEGLARDGQLDAVQLAFLDQTAFQCGFCTPDMIMMTRALLNEIPQPTEAQVRDYLRGNLCRCTGYASIVRAALNAAEKEKRTAEPADARV
ncbi:MAG TPA: (2Fe-2S)-binding protein [Anaerolineae bacterium]|nr:(2Fe-2S)-binding protein [Anaerolineae bacterium]